MINDDLNCSPLSASIGLDNIKLPDNLLNIDINTAREFAEKISLADDLYGEEGSILYQPDDNTVFAAAEGTRVQDEYFKLLGETRFNGLDLKNYIYTRYTVITGTDQTISSLNLSATSTITLCDTEGYPYTVSVPLSTKFLDSQQKEIVFPLFDSRGSQITLPLLDSQGKFVLTESISAFDAVGTEVYFPLKDIYGNYVKYPVRDINGSIVSVPLRSNPSILTNVSAAKIEFDKLYDYSKDKHAHLYVDYILSQQENYNIGIFYGNIKFNTKMSMPNMKYFIVGFYTKTSTNTQDILSDDLIFYTKYFDDRTTFVINQFTQRGGIATYTNYNVDFSSSNTTSTATMMKDTSILSTLGTSNWDISNKESSKDNKITKSSYVSELSTIKNDISAIKAQLGIS